MEESICRIELEIEDTTYIAKVQTDMGGPRTHEWVAGRVRTRFWM